MQMAYELFGILAGNVSLSTGENVKPAYGGDEESFLRKVITPIYDIVEKVYCINESLPNVLSLRLSLYTLSR